MLLLQSLQRLALFTLALSGLAAIIRKGSNDDDVSLTHRKRSLGSSDQKVKNAVIQHGEQVKLMGVSPPFGGGESRFDDRFRQYVLDVGGTQADLDDLKRRKSDLVGHGVHEASGQVTRELMKAGVPPEDVPKHLRTLNRVISRSSRLSASSSPAPSEDKHIETVRGMSRLSLQAWEKAVSESKSKHVRSLFIEEANRARDGFLGEMIALKGGDAVVKSSDGGTSRRQRSGREGV